MKFKDFYEMTDLDVETFTIFIYNPTTKVKEIVEPRIPLSQAARKYGELEVMEFYFILRDVVLKGEPS